VFTLHRHTLLSVTNICSVCIVVLSSSLRTKKVNVLNNRKVTHRKRCPLFFSLIAETYITTDEHPSCRDRTRVTSERLRR